MKYLNIILFLYSISVFAQINLKYEENICPTYEEAINYYKYLDEKFEEAKLFECEKTDIGKPLHLFVISSDKDFNPISIKEKNKRIILINNGIHAGETCGIDASLQLSNDFLFEVLDKDLLENIVLCIIPVYNVGGYLNRSSFGRVNQIGPEEYGFRANGKNINLNRDFTKCDTENSKSFAKIFHEWEPNIFIDTHTSDGADYSYVMTLIPVHYLRLTEPLGLFLKDEMIPSLYRKMEEKKWEMIPYVMPFKQFPEDGIRASFASPRFSSSFTGLFNTIGFMSEAHMYKTYKERVLATYNFILSTIEFTDENYIKFGELKNEADENLKNQNEFFLTYERDTTKYDMIKFKGYEVKYKTSSVTNKDIYYYDQNAPYEKEIKYYNYYKEKFSVKKPEYYIVPQAWSEVIELLKINNVKMSRLSEDSKIIVEVYYIRDCKTSKRETDFHYYHEDFRIEIDTQEIQFFKGDYVIQTNQIANKYIVEMLEPKGEDSFFRWNFFDPILQRHEYFEPYVFDEIADEILKSDQKLRDEFEKKKLNEIDFAQNSYAQYDFIYRNSPHYEECHQRYPVYRLNGKINLSLEL
ncbi:MAG: hypothetical protein JXA68_08880 [Ignavibacteriales bacterium]|nr:hypothetical protein [Ignavibacteriales bacterium]